MTATTTGGPIATTKTTRSEGTAAASGTEGAAAAASTVSVEMASVGFRYTAWTYLAAVISHVAHVLNHFAGCANSFQMATKSNIILCGKNNNSILSGYSLINVLQDVQAKLQDIKTMCRCL